MIKINRGKPTDTEYHLEGTYSKPEDATEAAIKAHLEANGWLGVKRITIRGTRNFTAVLSK